MLGIELDEVVQTVFAIRIVEVQHKRSGGVLENVFVELFTIPAKVVEQVLLVAYFLVELEVIEESLDRRVECESFILISPLALLPFEVYIDV